MVAVGITKTKCGAFRNGARLNFQWVVYFLMPKPAKVLFGLTFLLLIGKRPKHTSVPKRGKKNLIL
jgi:hypothetical protein